MAKDSRVEELSREQLIALVLELQRQMALLREENARLKRSGRRQAAPFSKEKPVPNPKKPGRKKGQGPFGRRAAPVAEPKATVDAQAPPCCPFCGGPLEEEALSSRPQRMCQSNRNRRSRSIEYRFAIAGTVARR